MPYVPPGYKVFGWYDNKHRCIVAAKSKAAAARAAGVQGPWQMWNLCETGNEIEIAIACYKIGVVFYQRDGERDPRAWREEPDRGTQGR